MWGVSERGHRRRVVAGHAFVGWASCAATIGIGQAVWSLETALVVHAIGAPIYFVAVSRHYFRRHTHTTPLQAAAVFTGFVMTVDFFLVGLAINRSLEMFTSVLGTWIPFASIFTATWVTGRHTTPTDSAGSGPAPKRATGAESHRSSTVP